MNSKNLDILYIDTLGLKCPMPLLLLKKSIQLNPLKKIFCIRANDPLAELDIKLFCCENGGCVKEIAHKDYYSEITIEF